MKTMKKFSVILRCFLLFMTIMITTGSMTAEAAAPKLNAKSKTIYVGRSYQLKVKNTKKKVTWKSSDKSIATVSSKGVVKGKKAGNVTITAKVANKKLTCKVAVKNNVSVNKSTITLKKGKSTKVMVATQKKVTITYHIKDTNIVSCKWGNWQGKKSPLTITAKNPGTTTVTITNAYSKEKVKIKVKVPQVWDSVEVVIPDTIGEQGYETNRMKILDYSFYQPYSGSSYYYMNVKFKMVQYGKTGRSNWGEDVYFYDANGNILDKSQLYASGLALNKTFTDELMVPKNTAKIEFMEYPSVEEPIKVTSVSLPTSKQIKVGETVKLTATIRPYGAADSSDIIWTSSDPSVATVKDGVVTAISEGEAYITASVGGKEDWCRVSVEAKKVTRVDLPTSKRLQLGETVKLTAAISPSDAADSSDVTWISSDPSVATVKNGLVTAVGEGEAYITARVGDKEDRCLIYVDVKKVTSVLLPTSKRIKVGGTVELTATIYPSDAANSSDITWISSDPSVATVKNGVVTAISAGEAYITASVGGKEARCLVYVESDIESNTPEQNYQILKKYLLTNGGINTSGNRVISDTYTTNKIKYQFGVVYDGSADKYTFLWTAVATDGTTQSSVAMDIKDPSNLILHPQIIFLYNNVGGFETTATISAASYTGKQDVAFTINSSTGNVSSSEIVSFSNTTLRSAFSMWNTFLSAKVGLKLNNLGFTNYSS